MSSKGRPKSVDALTNLWIAEQYYHGDDLAQSWGKPIKVCYSEKEARDCIELESALYSQEIEFPEIDREISRMITVRPNNGDSFYPAMDFWYYHCILVEED